MRHSILRATLSCILLLSIAGAVSQSALAQSVWTKLKIAALQQACRGGDQKACQDLAKMGQPAPQPGQQPQPSTQRRTAQSRQSQPDQAQNQPAQGQGQSGQVAPPAGTKVDVKMMAPVEQGAKFSISPHGVHVATIEDSGSRVVVYYDGVAGPKFDEIYTINTGLAADMQIAFSPDGKRYAYCARSGGDLVVMVDGKELIRSSDSYIENATSHPCALVGFTSNSEHVFVSSEVWRSSSRGGRFTRFYFDGKLDSVPGGGDDSAWTRPAFSPDGNHYAYVAVDPANPQRWSLVIDGKVAPYQGGDPQWSGDSQHLYTTIEHSGPHPYMEAMLDGKPFLRANKIDLHVPAKGNMVVAEVTTVNGNQPEQFLFIDGKKVPGSDVIGSIYGLDMVTLSPDGKRYAARITLSQGRQFVFLDGKRQQEYQTVDNIGFTADSSKVVYSAFANGKPFVIYGDQESDSCAPELSRISYAPVGNGAGTVCQGMTPSVFLDGKMLPIVGIGGSRLRFTPDGKHFAYVAFLRGQALQLVLDGVAQKNSRLTASTAVGNQYVFSPDGEHVAHFAGSPNPARPGAGVFLDGKFIPIGDVSMFYRIAFTPDSRHIMWAEQVPGRAAIGIYVDGKLVVQPDAALGPASPAPWWDISPDGALSILAQHNNSLERITITPSPNTSVQTFFAGAR